MNIKFDIIVKNGSYKFPASELIPKNYNMLQAVNDKNDFRIETAWQKENQTLRMMFNIAFILGAIHERYELELGNLNCVISLEYIGVYNEPINS